MPDALWQPDCQTAITLGLTANLVAVSTNALSMVIVEQQTRKQVGIWRDHRA